MTTIVAKFSQQKFKAPWSISQPLKIARKAENRRKSYQNGGNDSWEIQIRKDMQRGNYRGHVFVL